MADALTKPLSSHQFQFLCTQIGIANRSIVLQGHVRDSDSVSSSQGIFVADGGIVGAGFSSREDFGALPAFQVAVVHPERVSGVIILGAPFTPPGAFAIQMQLFPKGFYVQRWRPGRAEADFGRFDVKTVIRNIYILFCRSELQVASDDQEIMDLVDPSTPLPVWFTQEDLKVYSSLYENSGFHTAPLSNGDGGEGGRRSLESESSVGLYTHMGNCSPPTLASASPSSWPSSHPPPQSSSSLPSISSCSKLSKSSAASSPIERRTPKPMPKLLKSSLTTAKPDAGRRSVWWTRSTPPQRRSPA
ncbi:hypothetical protein CK203_015201 [Vitis vinifera]|uniref:Uncharacterized protein n=1 Tax=Vitis vinifera TaxID=29760 RepID=A0A438JK37_VITVI|nr:hypothetical protein CK203_015201 [Vitis vinifera]